MRKVKVITDSTTDLPKSIAEEHGIEVIPARIILGKQNYPDNGSISTKELFEFAESTGSLPKTAPPSEYQFQEKFQKWLEEDYDIFFTGISSKIAETMRNALSAASKLVGGRISIIDSLSVSSGVGLQVLEAADLADKGFGLVEITKHVLSLRGKVRASIVLDTLRYLYIGGRCSRIASILGDTLNIKPTIDIIDGDVVQGERLRGKNYIDKFVEQVIKEPERIDTKRIFVTRCLVTQADEVKERLKNDYGFGNIIIADASPAISAHCGPGSLGIMYLYK